MPVSSPRSVLVHPAAPAWAQALSLEVAVEPDREAFEASAGDCEHDAVLLADAPGVEGWIEETACRAPIVVLLAGDNPEREAVLLAAGATETLSAAATADEAARTLRRAAARAAVAVRRAVEEERYRTLVEHASDIVTVLDEAGQYVYVSPSIQERLGYDPDALVGQSGFETVHPDDREAVMAVFMEAVQEPGATRTMSYRVITADGSVRHLEGVGRVVASPDGSVLGVINARDVTERVEAVGALRRAEEQQRRLREALPDVISRITYDGLVLDFHVPAVFETDYPAEAMIGKVLHDVIPAPLAAKYDAAVARVRAGEPSVSYRYTVSADGSPRTREIRIVQARDNEVLSVVRDVTAEVQAEAARRQHEAMLQQVVRSAPLVLFAYSPEGRIVFLEGQAVEHLSEADLVGRSVFDVYADVPEVAEAARRALGGEAFTTRIDLEGRSFEVWFAPTHDDDGELARVIGVAVDVTDLREQQAALAQSRSELRALAVYLQTIREEERTRISREVHDVLGQSLTAIRYGVGRLARYAPEDDADAARRADETRELIDELIGHVRQIAADLRPGVLDDFGLPTALEWQAGRFTDRTEIACRVEDATGDADIPDHIATSAFRIAQEALTNVARHAEARSVTIALRADDERLVLSVRDDGRGFDPDAVAGKGSLGLVGMRERALAQGGVLHIDGAPGQGATVTVAFDLASADPGPAGPFSEDGVRGGAPSADLAASQGSPEPAVGSPGVSPAPPA